MLDFSEAHVQGIISELDELIQKPIFSIDPKALSDYQKDYFEEQCPKSHDMIEKARELIPGGVQHNLAFNYPFPLVFTKASGPWLEDLDGHRYFDFLQAGGPTVLGSNPPEIRAKVIDLLNSCGPSTGLFHEYEYRLAQEVADLIPAVDWLRMFNSGSEACMASIRVARLATKHRHVLKMGGAYHGWSDQLAYGIRVPGSKFTQAHGVPRKIFKYVDEFFPGDLNALESKLKAKAWKGGTAAVLLEPVGPESGTRPISEAFIKGAEKLCHKYGALLVFDEVVTAFRLSPHGASSIFNVEPDLTVFGKVIAGGYPGAGGLGGKKEYMKYLAAGIQTGDRVKKALVGGTMAATPLSALAGYYTIRRIVETQACEKANELGDQLTAGLKALIKKHGLPFVAFNQGSICHLETVGTMHFCVDWKHPWKIPGVLKETSRRKSEMEHMGCAYMAEGLVTLAGSRLYLSAAYDEELLKQALEAFDRVFAHVVELKK